MLVVEMNIHSYLGLCLGRMPIKNLLPLRLKTSQGAKMKIDTHLLENPPLLEKPKLYLLIQKIIS